MKFEEWWEREPVGDFEGIHAGHVRNAFEAGQANPPDGWKLVPIVVVDELYMRVKDLKKIQTTPGKDKE